MSTTKHHLYTHCAAFVNERIATIKAVLAEIDEALLQETKSSAGDKHETGRAMIQLEQETNNRQLEEALVLRAVLQTIDPEATGELITAGSLVITDKANYYLSISASKVVLDGKLYYCISPGSPIGQVLVGKQVGDKVTFNSNGIKIVEVI